MSDRMRDSFFAASASTSWLFWITLCFGSFLAVFMPYSFWAQASWQAENGLTLSALGSYCMAVLSGMVGLRWCVLSIMSYASIVRHAQEEEEAEPSDLPLVSILVPAYCESACIHDAMTSLVELDYPEYEIIVVDDGSSDDTYQRALPFAGTHRSAHGVCHVQVFTKANQGKWSAHNFGLRHATASLVLCIDADSRIEPGALRRMVRLMSDPRVGAVAGQIRVRNRNSVLGVFQAFEYLLANGSLRLSQGSTGTVMIVPGPIGLFRREALDRVEALNEREAARESRHMPGPFSPLTFAEDFHLSLSMLTLGYRVEYEPFAIAHTKAPSSLHALISQRYRWNRGSMQVLFWYLRRTLSGAQSPVKLKAWIGSAFLVDYFCFPILYFVLLACLLMYFFQGQSLENLAPWVAASCMMNILTGSLYAVAHRDRVVLSVLSPVFEFYQGILLNCAWFISFLDECRGAGMRW